MNNETIKRAKLEIKLRGDNVYDVYLDGKFMFSRGSKKGILEEANSILEEALKLF
jgi:hypothetical protein